MESWWLRSPGQYNEQAMVVTGCDINSKDKNTQSGVRPAMWIKIKTEEGEDNDGE